MRKNWLISEEPSKIIWLSFLLGIISISCALVIGEKAFESTVIKLEQQYRKFYLREAKMLVRTAAAGDFGNEASFLRSIDEAWKDIEDKPADEYLCVVDKGSRLLLHSVFPETVGDDAGSNPIFSQRPEAESCLRGLATSQKEYVEDYISRDGKQQLGAFTPIPNKHWIVGLHRSKSALVNEIESGIKYTRYGFYVVCVLLMPLSWLLLFLIFRRAENRKRKIQEDLIVSEERYRLLAENSVDTIWLMNLDGTFIYQSPSVKQLLGYTPEEANSLTLEQTLVPESMAKIRRIFEQEDQKPIDERWADRSLQLEMHRKSGSTIWTEVAIRAVRNEENEIVALQGSTRDITEYKQGEEALAESERKWRNILINTPLVGIVLDTKARITFANKQLLDLTGYKESEVIGQEWFDLFIPENFRDEVRKVFDTVMSRNNILEFSNYENEIVTKSGEIRNTAWSNLVSTDIDGNLLDVTCLGLDLTERKQALAALQASDGKYRNIFENAVEGFYQSTPDGHFTSVNPAFVSMFGYASADELVSKDFDIDRHFYANPEDRTQWKQILQKNGKVQNYEFKAKRKNGSYFWASDSTRAVFDQNGKIVQYEGNVSDINIRKEAESIRIKIEEELRKRNNFIETIMDNLPIGLAVNYIDEGKAIYINKIFEKIYGWPKEELQNIEEFFNKIYPDNEYRDQIKSMILSDINSGDPERMQWEGIEITNKSGQKRIVTAKNIPLYEQNLMISTVQDITESASLQTRLQQAQKMEAIGSLAGGIAHDFNNILFPIMGLSELLMEDLPHGSPEYGNVQQIFIAGKRGSDLVKQILAFGRQSEKKMMPVLIQQILKEVLKLSRSTIPSDIEITQEIQIDCGRVMADPVQLHQIAMNLITNAYHAVEETEEKKIAIKLRETKIEGADADLSGKSLEPGQYAVLSVTDTGCGIDPAIYDKIFEPYFTTKKQGKGTGLGLATVYGIAKEYGGDIKVYSELGKGTTFNIYLPILSNNNDIEDIEKIEALVGGTESILLVEDEESVFKLEKLILERLGYQVIGRTSSIEALEAFKANQDNYDLILTDMNMPNMTGAQLAEKIKAIKPEIPIIICTGFSDRINKEKAKSIGIDGFLMKPVVKSEMSKMVRRILDIS